MHFKNTIINTFGNTGKIWLEKLPGIISTLQKKWQLSNLEPVPNMTYHYVAKATRFPNIPGVIKIGCDKQLTTNEAAVLKYFDSKGSISLIDYNKEHNSLLLEQAIPGHSLKSIFPKKIDFVIDSYASVVQQIQQHSLPQTTTFPTISSWFEALDRCTSSKIDLKLLTSAITIKNNLLSTMKDEKLLHGDLHLDKILESNGHWVCIDPKGVIGEIEFEVAAFDIFNDTEIKGATTEVFLKRIHTLSKVTHLSFERLKKWFFVRLVLSAVWSIEDNSNPSRAIRLALLLLKNLI